MQVRLIYIPSRSQLLNTGRSKAQEKEGGRAWGYYPHSVKKKEVLRRVKGGLGQGPKTGDGLFNVKQMEDFMEKDMWEDRD